MVTLTDTAAKKIADLRLEEGKPEWGLREIGRASCRERV